MFENREHGIEMILFEAASKGIDTCHHSNAPSSHLPRCNPFHFSLYIIDGTIHPPQKNRASIINAKFFRRKIYPPTGPKPPSRATLQTKITGAPSRWRLENPKQSFPLLCRLLNGVCRLCRLVSGTCSLRRSNAWWHRRAVPLRMNSRCPGVIPERVTINIRQWR